MKNYYTYGITCVVAWLPSAVSARSLRCFAIRSPGTAADRRRGINEQIFGQPGGSSLLSGGYNILVIRLVRYFAE